MKLLALNVPQLLTGLIGLGTVTLGIVAFDAERLIGAVDDLRALQNADHQQITQQAVTLTQITPRVDALEVKYYDIQGRIIRMEPR